METSSAFEILLEEDREGFLTCLKRWVPGNLTIKMVKSPRAPSGARFLPAEIKDGAGTVWWRFEKGPPHDLAWLLEDWDEGKDPIIVYVCRRNLYRVDPLTDLTKRQAVLDGAGGIEWEGGRSRKELIRLKDMVADSLSLEPVFSEGEKRFIRAMNAQMKKKNEAQRAIENAERQRLHEEAQARKRQKLDGITARGKIEVFTSNGSPRKGYPVVNKDEYGALWDKAPCILVESYDDETKMVGAPKEFFFVSKKAGSGRVVARDRVEVSSKNPKTTPVEIVKTVFVEVDRELTELHLYKGMDALKEIQKKGLNSGAMVALLADEAGMVNIHRVKGKEILPLKGNPFPVIVVD
ncbi:MAG: hypothetical protein AAB545_01110 [Patescibacteria group bacterium]